MSHIDQSVWYASAMLDGGSNESSSIIALDNSELRAIVQQVIIELEAFKVLTFERHNNFVNSRPGSDIDDRYDDAFIQFISLADSIEKNLKKRVVAELSGFQQLHYLMALLVLMIAVAMALILWRHEKQSVDYLQVLHETQSKLEALSNTDPLTGLANRRAFDAALAAEFNRAKRSSTPIALMMIDVDFFKHFNDTYGHPEGDKCLQKVATNIQQLCKRSMDLVSRYGGEEFAIILPNSDNAELLAISMLKSVEAMGIPHSTSSVANIVTISIGITEAIPLPEMQAEELVAMADKALYQAKSSGRNRMVSLEMNAV